MHGAIKNILFPTDFSPNADNALNMAISVAIKHNADLHLLHVIIPQFISMIGEIPFGTAYENYVDLEKINKHTIDNLANTIRKKNRIAVFSHTKIGSISETIEEMRHQQDIDLIIMGTHGNSPIKNLLIGSNTFKTIKTTSCPVLTIPSHFEATHFFNILFPVRNVEGIDEKYAITSSFIQKNQTKIELLGVVDFYDFSTFEVVSKKVEAVLKELILKGISSSCRTVFCSNIANFIIEYAQFNHADLIVINANIDGDWRELFGGTYTQKIINYAQRPVLYINTTTIKTSQKKSESDSKSNISSELILSPISNIHHLN